MSNNQTNAYEGFLNSLFRLNLSDQTQSQRPTSSNLSQNSGTATLQNSPFALNFATPNQYERQQQIQSEEQQQPPLQFQGQQQPQFQGQQQQQQPLLPQVQLSPLQLQGQQQPLQLQMQQQQQQQQYQLQQRQYEYQQLQQQQLEQQQLLEQQRQQEDQQRQLGQQRQLDQQQQQMQQQVQQEQKMRQEQQLQQLQQQLQQLQQRQQQLQQQRQQLEQQYQYQQQQQQAQQQLQQRQYEYQRQQQLLQNEYEQNQKFQLEIQKLVQQAQEKLSQLSNNGEVQQVVSANNENAAQSCSWFQNNAANSTSPGVQFNWPQLQTPQSPQSQSPPLSPRQTQPQTQPVPMEVDDEDYTSARSHSRHTAQPFALAQPWSSIISNIRTRSGPPRLSNRNTLVIPPWNPPMPQAANQQFNQPMQSMPPLQPVLPIQPVLPLLPQNNPAAPENNPIVVALRNPNDEYDEDFNTVLDYFGTGDMRGLCQHMRARPQYRRALRRRRPENEENPQPD